MLTALFLIEFSVAWCAESVKLPARVSFAARAVLSRCSLYEALRYGQPICSLVRCFSPAIPMFPRLGACPLASRFAGGSVAHPGAFDLWVLSDFRKLVKGASRNARVLISILLLFVLNLARRSSLLCAYAASVGTQEAGDTAQADCAAICIALRVRLTSLPFP